MGDGALAHGHSFYTGFLSRRAVFTDSNCGNVARRWDSPEQQGRADKKRRKKREDAFPRARPSQEGGVHEALRNLRYAICVMNGDAKIANELLIVRLEQRFHRAAFAEDRFNIGHRAQMVQLPTSLAKLQRGEASVSAVCHGLQFFVSAGSVSYTH